MIERQTKKKLEDEKRAKLLREIAKKRKMEQDKQRQDEVLDDLFDYGLSKKKSDEKRPDAGGLEALRDESSSDSSSDSESQNSDTEKTQQSPTEIDVEIEAERNELRIRN
jgi:hypothetical protein